MERKQINGFQGWREKGRLVVNSRRVLLEVLETILYLFCGSVYMTVYIGKIHRDMLLGEQLNFIYVNYTSINLP